MMQAADVLHLEGVQAWYDDYQVLHGVDWVFAPGSTTLVRGANGSGKTTLLKCISAAIDYDGKVMYGGKTVMPGSHNVATCYDNVPAYVHLPGLDNLRIVYRIDPQIGYQYLDAYTLNKAVQLYSLGQRHRLALAGVLHSNSPVLVLDEPFTGLDPDGCERVRHRLAQLRGTKTIIIATNEPKQVRQFVDQECLVENGRLVAAP